MDWAALLEKRLPAPFLPSELAATVAEEEAHAKKDGASDGWRQAALDDLERSFAPWVASKAA